MEHFKSARLVGRQLAPDDLDFLDGLHSDPGVMRYIGGVRDRATTEAWLAANLAHWDEHGFGQWVLQLDGRPIGRGGLRLLDAGIAAQVAASAPARTPMIDVGNTFVSRVWGRGLATEATEAFLAAAEGLPPAGSQPEPVLCAITLEGNDASSRVLEKNGFGFERWVDHDWGPHKFFTRPGG